MKIREQLVSNSSSTSFFAVVDNKAKTKVTLSFEIELDNYAAKRITTIDELNKYYIEYYDPATNDPVAAINEILKDDDLKKKYGKMKNEIKNGKVVLVASISSEGEPEEQFLYDYGIDKIAQNSKNIVIFEQ